MSKTLLIVEDEYIIATTLMMELQKLGYITVHAPSSKKTFEKLKSTKIDLILMDITLHNTFDGIELCAMIQKEYDIPIIFLTSYTKSELGERLKNAIYHGFASKLGDILILDKKIKEVFELFENKEKLNELGT